MKYTTLHDLKYDEFDDLPSAPGGGAEAAEPVDGTADLGDFEGVQLLGDVIPIGTYKFRMDSYTEGWDSKFPDDATEQEKSFGYQPHFQARWKVQEEPHTGRLLFDFIPWVNKKTLDAARQGNPVAVQLRKDRLMRAKSIMKACNYNPAGGFNFKVMLDEHPECKIQVSTTEKKGKDPVTGKYTVATGELQNRIVKYLPLQRPA